MVCMYNKYNMFLLSKYKDLSIKRERADIHRTVYLVVNPVIEKIRKNYKIL